jgi:hypothetical protein
MARKKLDITGNETLDLTIAKIQAMFVELYAASSTSPNPSVTSLVASGDVSGGTLTTAGLASVGTLTSAGLATVGSAKIDTGTKTAAATAGAATLAKGAGVITTEALTTAAAAAYTLTLTDSAIAAADQVFASVANGTNSAGSPAVGRVTPGAGSVTIEINNRHATDALNGTLKIAFVTFKN